MSASALTVARDDELVAAELPGRGQYHPGLLFSFLLALILLWCGWQLMNPATLPIRQVAIAGEFRHLVPERLEGAVIGVMRGGFFNVNVETIQETLLLEPWVRHVAVRRVWPDALTVHVLEQSALARWGEQGLLNAEAGFFAPARESIPAGLPILHGPPGSELLLMEYFHKVVAILAASGLAVEAMTLNERRAWVVVLNKGLVINLGKQNIQARLEYFADYVLFQLRDSLQDIAAVDMRYTNGFAVRLKNDALIVKSEQE